MTDDFEDFDDGALDPADESAPRMYARIGDVDVELEGGPDDDSLDDIRPAFRETLDYVVDTARSIEDADDRGVQ